MAVANQGEFRTFGIINAFGCIGGLRTLAFKWIRTPLALVGGSRLLYVFTKADADKPLTDRKKAMRELTQRIEADYQ